MGLLIRIIINLIFYYFTFYSLITFINLISILIFILIFYSKFLYKIKPLIYFKMINLWIILVWNLNPRNINFYYQNFINIKEFIDLWLMENLLIYHCKIIMMEILLLMAPFCIIHPKNKDLFHYLKFSQINFCYIWLYCCQSKSR